MDGLQSDGWDDGTRLDSIHSFLLVTNVRTTGKYDVMFTFFSFRFRVTLDLVTVD